MDSIITAFVLEKLATAAFGSMQPVTTKATMLSRAVVPIFNFPQA